jgi:hypothetical protein
MTRAARQIIETFEALPEPDKKAVAVEILRQTVDENYSNLEDTDLIFAADQVFLELDRREDEE